MIEGLSERHAVRSHQGALLGKPQPESALGSSITRPSSQAPWVVCQLLFQHIHAQNTVHTWTPSLAGYGTKVDQHCPSIS